MKTVKNNILRGVIEEGACIIALGCFDGVHLGHRQVLQAAKRIADDKKLPLAVLSFSSPPRDAFSAHPTPLIISDAEKSAIFEEIGVDYNLSVTPTKEFLNTSAEDFVDLMLHETLGAKHVVCGFNYGFGTSRRGDAALLKKLCAAHETDVTVIPEYRVNGAPVSSSAIRRAIADGDTEAIKNMLGRYYSITARVVNGQRLARKLGFPTINMIPEPNLALIRNGVYVSGILIDGEQKYGITNVGVRPTVKTQLLCAETHIFDYEGDLYGKEIRVEFLHFLRGEMRFENVECLALRVESDIARAREHIKNIQAR